MNREFVCICEGGAEQSIFDILLDNDMLIFSKEQLVGNSLLDSSYRNSKKFESDYLNMEHSSKLKIYLVQDKNPKSEKFKFKISKLYEHYIDSITFVITHPEIEMLLIIAENQENEYQKYKSRMKPSVFCKRCINKFKNEPIKQQNFIKNYFKDCSLLVNCLKIYAQKYFNIKDKDKISIYDLIKEDIKKNY